MKTNNSKIATSDGHKLFNLFRKDTTFLKLLSVIATYPEKIEVDHVVWWLYRCNVSCFDSNLFSQDDFISFAIFLLNNKSNLN